MFRASRIAAFLFLALWGAAVCRADVAQTLQGRLDGAIQFKPNALAAGTQSVPWDDLVYLVRDSVGRTLPAPQTVRLKNGEVWGVEILAVAAKKIRVRFSLFGPREIDLGLVAALEFVPELPADATLKPNTLYREEGEPIPGSLLWIDEKKIAMDSPLGVLTVPRQGASRLTLAKGLLTAVRPNEDEVGLIDGSILRGTLKPGTDPIGLDHAVLGKLLLPAAAVRFICRHPAAVLYLAELAPQSVDAVPLIARAVLPETVSYTADSAGEASGSARGIRVWPKCALSFATAKAPGKKVLLRTTVGPLDGARGDVRVRIAAGDHALFEKEFAPEDKRESLSLEVPDGSLLRFDVDFGTRMRFPCGAALGEPHLVIER